MDYAKTLKLQFRVRDLDLPERRKRYTSSREEETKKKRVELTIVGECEMHYEEGGDEENRRV